MEENIVSIWEISHEEEIRNLVLDFEVHGDSITLTNIKLE